MSSLGKTLQAWTDLSLRTKLLVFALGLVIVPGATFALVTFSGARAALEREVRIQLQQTAERGADAVTAALDRAQSDARSWASQDLMRDLLVSDLDKRISRFLRTVADTSTYLAAVCVDLEGTVVAASSGEWIGRTIERWNAMPLVANGADALVGPAASPDFPGAVLEVAVPIGDPDRPGGRIGSLVLVYDWNDIDGVLDAIRTKLGKLGKHTAAIVVDRDGVVIGGVTFDGQPARASALAAERWRAVIDDDGAERGVEAATADPAVGVVAGAARVQGATHAWSVVFLERTDEALAPVHAMRTRWILISACLLALGLAGGALLARQVTRPLEDVTRATSRIAAHPDRELPLLSVQSRDEVGQLTESFNSMTIELKRSQEEALAAAKFAFAGELAAMIAHEVRTPLSVMRSSAQMLAHPAPMSAGHNTELVEMIIAEVDRVERVVTGLIQLARPMEQRVEPTSLRDVLTRAAEFAAAHAEQQHIEVTCDFAASQRAALCDPEQAYQVVLNLLINAVQAMPQGGRLWLRTLAERAGMVGFAVADDGPGLPSAIRDRIFRPFVTGRDDGTGLGLTFVERVVKAHHGSVSVHSEPGHGTVFEVRLPAAESA